MKKNLYDKVVFFYDQLALAVLGHDYRQSKYALLDTVKHGDQVLYIGGGSGENLPLLVKTIGEEGCIYFVEGSNKMLQKAKRRLSADQKRQVIFLHQTDFNMLPKQCFDVVITQYLLDILPDKGINALFEEVHKRTGSTSKWLLVDFFDQKSRRWLQWGMILFFRLTTGNPRKDLPEYSVFFRKYGWKPEQERPFKGGWIKAMVFRKT